MRRINYIAMDLAVSHTTFEAQTSSGHVLKTLDLETTGSCLVNAIKEIRRPRCVVFEECTLADWVYRLVRPHADAVVVCDPRRNRLVASGDKEDAVDAHKLCELARLDALHPVHHPVKRSHVDQRRWVWLYRDAIQWLVRFKNQIKSGYRFHGILASRRADPYDIEERKYYLDQLPSNAARQQLRILYGMMDEAASRCVDIRRRLARFAKRHPVIKRFLEIPGFGPVYATAFWAIVDTPFRFKTPQKLWAYAGLGIHRKKSGKAKAGKPHSNGPEHLNWPFNPMLKNVAKGVAQHALYGQNAFKEKFEQLIGQGTTVANARSTVARKCLVVPWAMWKTGDRYRPELVRAT